MRARGAAATPRRLHQSHAADRERDHQRHVPGRQGTSRGEGQIAEVRALAEYAQAHQPEVRTQRYQHEPRRQRSRHEHMPRAREVSEKVGHFVPGAPAPARARRRRVRRGMRSSATSAGVAATGGLSSDGVARGGLSSGRLSSGGAARGGRHRAVCHPTICLRVACHRAACRRTAWLGVAQRCVSRSLDQLEQIVERGVVDLQAGTQQATCLGCPVRLVLRLVRRVDQRPGLEAPNVERRQIDE